MSHQYQICYFPYLSLKDTESVKFHNFTVWNFSKLRTNRIKDKALREYITILLHSNVINNKPIEGIGIISKKDKDDFSILNDSQIKQIDELKAVLFLVAVSRNNIHGFDHAGFMMFTAENFNVIYQNFKLNSKHTSYSTGRIVNITTGGYKVGKIKFEKPKHVLSPNFKYDEKLLDAVEILKIKNQRFFRIIIRATDAFMNGYKNSDDVSSESRILEQSRAFEILFNLPERSQRKEFKDRIEKYCSLKDERKRRYKSERPNNRRVWEIGTKQKMWADRFYTLRNHIIHGQPLKDNEFIFCGQRHHDIAL